MLSRLLPPCKIVTLPTCNPSPTHLSQLHLQAPTHLSLFLSLSLSLSLASSTVGLSLDVLLRHALLLLVDLDAGQRLDDGPPLVPVSDPGPRKTGSSDTLEDEERARLVVLVGDVCVVAAAECGEGSNDRKEVEQVLSLACLPQLVHRHVQQQAENGREVSCAGAVLSNGVSHGIENDTGVPVGHLASVCIAVEEGVARSQHQACEVPRAAGVRETLEELSTHISASCQLFKVV
mmetsp:Transcript_3067/g.10718  ORF Transcript_3067/g.10718 Transcript_3067/m.10718 type:complete len:234 (+) Transcript_3067:1131-1832(+)